MNFSRFSSALFLKRLIHFFCIMFLGALLSLSTLAEDENERESESESENPRIESHLFLTEDLYLNVYKSVSNTSGKTQDQARATAYSSVAKRLEITETQLNEMLLINKTNAENAGAESKLCDPNNSNIQCTEDLMEQLCQSNGNLEKFQLCQSKLQAMVDQQMIYTTDHLEIQRTTKASQAYVNGTLQDTGGINSFDIVVDLNIVDTIVFGEKMTVPKTGSPFLPYNPFKDKDDDEEGSNNNEESGDDDENDEENDDQSEEESNEDENNENEGDNDQEEEGEKENDTNTNLEEFCADLDALYFSNTITTQIIDINTTNQTEERHDSTQN